MALDSRRKRGSAIGIGIPWRSWVTIPDGTITAADRQMFLKLCSAVTITAGSTGVKRRRLLLGAVT